MFNPEVYHPVQSEFSVDMEETGRENQQSFYRKLLEYFKVLWNVENDVYIKTPDIYAFRFLVK